MRGQCIFFFELWLSKEARDAVCCMSTVIGCVKDVEVKDNEVEDSEVTDAESKTLKSKTL